MLSLRIEQTASGPVLRVNNDNEKQKRRSVTTETSTESEFDYSTYEYDDKIKVIRRYEMPPDEQILYSGKTQVTFLRLLRLNSFCSGKKMLHASQ